jgi:hypothetical protein
MPSRLDAALDVGFFVFHTLWVVFVCAGWAWRRTRPWHGSAVALTALSWFGLGIWHGWGYCPLTDWHWQVRERLGHRDPASYLQLLISTVAGVELSARVADALAVGTLSIVGPLTLFLNLRDRTRAPHHNGHNGHQGTST